MLKSFHIKIKSFLSLLFVFFNMSACHQKQPEIMNYDDVTIIEFDNADVIEELLQDQTLLTFVVQSIEKRSAAQTPEGPTELLNLPIELSDGSMITLMDYMGKNILIIFSADHCPYCYSEATFLESIYQDYQEQNFMILVIEIFGVPPNGWQEFRNQYGITFPLGHVTDDEIVNTWDLSLIPYHALINEEGLLTNEFSGFKSEEYIRDEVETFLGN